MCGSVGALICWIGFAASIKFSSRVACALLRSAQPEMSPPPGVVTAAINVYRGSPHASSRAYIASLRDVCQPVDLSCGRVTHSGRRRVQRCADVFACRGGNVGRNSRNERVLHRRRAIHRAQHHRHVEVALDPKTTLALLPRTDTSNVWHRCCLAASTSAELNCGAAAAEDGDEV